MKHVVIVIYMLYAELMKKTMNDLIQDKDQRELALNPRKSFIVQAPAGSGKTEILTQRFLVLLSIVKAPEEILAITFTKKSATEMRSRIIHSLKKASLLPEPSTPHEKKTWKLAKNALKRDQEMQWNLLANPNRLRIQTIDSFNASLTRHLPILSHFGAPLDIIDNPTFLYQQAVHELLSHLEENVEWSDHIAQLLFHLDNDLNKVADLLVTMLAKRDQWLPYIMMNADDELLREKLENHLAFVIIDILNNLTEFFPIEQKEELLKMARFAANHLADTKSDSKILFCKNLSVFPDAQIENYSEWLGISYLLLTNDHQWRKKIDKDIGFPAPSSSKNADEKMLYAEMKERIKHLILKLSENEKLRTYLEALRKAPSYQYQEMQWETLHALHQVLRIAVAQLKVVFQQHAQIDYIENAEAALSALGPEENPTDLALALDYQIQHILIDEFQDTSNSQYRLLEKLINGWETEDGRTLFIVGDPMQSIYRFREAEVSLFIRARKHGIGQIKLMPLTLTVNFRSTSKIVDWVNQTFQKVFPANEDIITGAISYSDSTAHLPNENDQSNVSLHPFIHSTAKNQADAIVRLVREAQEKNPTDSIAILVRSRTHLAEIIPILKSANIYYQAINIDPLNKRPAIQDLMALTRALLYPADRIAWLAILRAPWCGLSLSDLLLLTGNNSERSILQQLQNENIFSSLSEDGQKRLARIVPILTTKVMERHRVSLRLWIESTWIALGGPATLNQSSELNDAAAYFDLIDKMENSNTILNIDHLTEYVSQLYAAPNTQTESHLQIMTIHNAKGLEFDVVILPHLERKASHDDKQLLLWMERPRENEDAALLLAPVHAIGEEKDSIYEYIKQQHTIKTEHENGRLLYVAATRAKKQLHLFFNLHTNEKEKTEIAKPIANSLLEKLWPAIYSHFQYHSQEAHEIKPIDDMAEKKSRQLKRFSLEWINPVQLSSLDVGLHQKKTGFLLPQHNPRTIGILIHRILQQLCTAGKNWWQAQHKEQQQIYIQNNLLQLGMLSSDISDSCEIVFRGIHNTLSDARGQWIIHPHTDAKAEFPLTALIEGEIKSLIIDRTFIDEAGNRWIIDYKTSLLPDNNLEKFLQTERQQYEAQLNQYSLAMQHIDSRPIRLGLYFPLVPAWCEW